MTQPAERPDLDPSTEPAASLSGETQLADDDYVTRLRDEVESHRNETEAGTAGDATYIEQAFTNWAAELLEENGYIGGFEPAAYQYGPPSGQLELKLNGFYIDPLEGRAAMIVTDWNGGAVSDSKIPKRQIESLVALGTSFLEKALLQDPPLYRKLEPSRPHAQFAAQLWEHRDAVRRMTLVVLVNGLASEAPIDDRMVGDIRVSVEIWDAKRLVRLNDGRMTARGDLSIDFARDFGGALSCIPAPESDPRYTAYLAVLPADVLARIYDQFGPRLLEENVRAYLQLKGAVNRGIRKTILEEPGSFFAYNNGLSATAQRVDIEQGTGGPQIRSVIGLQIVNGAQTTGSIHRAWRTDNAPLRQVFVPVKITCVSGETHADIAGKISLYANSQNAVKLDDFSSNHPFHVRLEELSRRIWAPPTGSTRWYYERTRGQYQDELARGSRAEASKFRQENPSGQRFTKADVAKFTLAWEQRPDFVSLGAQKNFVRFSGDWLKTKDEDWKPDDVWYRELIAKAIVYNTLRSLVRAAELPGYFGNVVAYLMALLSARAGGRFDFAKVWSEQKLSEQLCNVLGSWIRPVYETLVQTADGRNVTEWAKKAACWDAISAVRLDELPDALPEIGESAVKGTDDLRPIDLSADRDQLFRLARDVTSGRVMKREDTLKELQRRLGLQRLTSERRAELESVLDDLPRVAFIDNEETTNTNTGLAIIRKLVRSGVRDRESLIRGIAVEWLNVQRVGSRVREEVESLLAIARRRRVLHTAGDDINCPTPLFDAYNDQFIRETLLDVVARKKRMYVRRLVVEAAIQTLGFSQIRAEMSERVERCIEALVSEGALVVPAEGALQRAQAETTA